MRNIPETIEIDINNGKKTTLVKVRLCALYQRWHFYKIVQYEEHPNNIFIKLEKVK